MDEIVRFEDYILKFLWFHGIPFDIIYFIIGDEIIGWSSAPLNTIDF